MEPKHERHIRHIPASLLLCMYQCPLILWKFLFRSFFLFGWLIYVSPYHHIDFSSLFFVWKKINLPWFILILSWFFITLCQVKYLFTSFFFVKKCQQMTKITDQKKYCFSSSKFLWFFDFKVCIYNVFCSVIHLLISM